MSRIDWAGGRFDIDFETNDMHRALYGWQDHVGTVVMYYRHHRNLVVADDVYDEAYGAELHFADPIPLPVLHATHVEGQGEFLEEGFYYLDDLHLSCSFEQLRRVGLSRQDIRVQNYIHDRIAHDDRLFRVEFIQVLGQVRNRDVIVSMDCSQVKPDEMRNSPEFKEFWSGADYEDTHVNH